MSTHRTYLRLAQGRPNCIDGFGGLCPPQKQAIYYRKAGNTWREHGAREYIECIADDVTPGKLTWFPQAIKLRHTDQVSVLP